MIDFALPDEHLKLARKTEQFIKQEIVPFERDPRQGPHGPAEALRLEMGQRARLAGLLSPHGPAEYGGPGLVHRGMAGAFEGAGWSPVRTLAVKIQTPAAG